MKQYLIILLFALGMVVNAQPVGQWTTHVALSAMDWIGQSGQYVYGANQQSVLRCDRASGEVFALHKGNVLSETGISSFACDDMSGVCIIGYASGNIDIIDVAGNATNQPAILNSQIVGEKQINSIYFRDGMAWIACGLGLVSMDLVSFHVRDFVRITSGSGSAIARQVIVFKDSLFVATDIGILKTPWNSIANADMFEPVQFTGDPELVKQLWIFQDKLHLLYQTNDYLFDTIFVYNSNEFQPLDSLAGLGINHVYPLDTTLMICHKDHIVTYSKSFKERARIYTYGKEGGIAPMQLIQQKDAEEYWVSDQNFGVVHVKWSNQWGSNVYNINSPGKGSHTRLSATFDELFILPGGNEFTYLQPDVHRLRDGIWTTHLLFSDEFPIFRNGNKLIESGDHYFIASDRGGLAKTDPSLRLENVYNEDNSPIEDLIDNSDYNYYGTTSVAQDVDGNIYVLQNKSEYPLKILLKNDTWLSVKFPESQLQSSRTGNMIVMDNGILALSFDDQGLVLYDPSGTPGDLSDDRHVLLNSSPDKGNLPSSSIRSIAQDKDGELWIGTLAGIAVIYNVESAFDSGFEGAQKIIVRQDGYNGYLFETESVESIVVDGANRKWVGTYNSGAYLISADGAEQVFRFTSENSPLPENRITDMAIVGKTGEVFIATESGVVSYRSDATEPSETLDNALIFPNPVKTNYTGVVSITNLTTNSLVRIADAAGNLVYETRSNGGQATWDGLDSKGRRIGTGVYLVFIGSEDGSGGVTRKLLVTN